jgi:hypothetical protein
MPLTFDAVNVAWHMGSSFSLHIVYDMCGKRPLNAVVCNVCGSQTVAHCFSDFWGAGGWSASCSCSYMCSCSVSSAAAAR